MGHDNKEILVEKINELEAKLQPFGLKRIQKINYEIDSYYEDDKWVAKVEEMIFVAENEEGETEEIDDFLQLTSFLDIDEEQIDEFEEIAENLYDKYYHIIMHTIEKIKNDTMSQEDLIVLNSLMRTEEESISFAS